MAEGLEEFEAILGKPVAEWESSSNLSSSPPFLPFLFHVHAADTYSLRIHVTDFHSYTWEATRSIQQLQDMRDNIGVGGSWSEFVDYFIESLKSDNVRLIVGGTKAKTASDHGAMVAKLIAHKSKGMPRISIPLHRLMESSASDAMANLSLGLFKAFKSKHNSSVKGEREQCNQLIENSSAGQETSTVALGIMTSDSRVTKGNQYKAKDESTRNEHDAALFWKRQKTSLPVTDVSKLDSVSASDNHESPKKQSTQDTRSTKVSNRAAPANRRAKVRGAVLEDTED